MAESAAGAFDVATALEIDPDDDVAVTRTELFVKGRLFARLEGELLVAMLPDDRADVLIERGLATPANLPSSAAGRWVLVADRAAWMELATEAREFVGEPPVGRQS